MTEADLRRALADAMEESLETMFFAPAGPEDPSRSPALDGAIVALLHFAGDPSGSLTVRIAPAAARFIAADFLGEERDAISPSRVKQVVCELANIVCGSVLSRVEGEFRLSVPEIIAPAAAPSEESQARPHGEPRAAAFAIVHAVETDGGSLEAILEMEGERWPTAEKYGF